MGKFSILALQLKDIDNKVEVIENEKSFIFSCSGILTISFTMWAIKKCELTRVNHFVKKKQLSMEIDARSASIWSNYDFSDLLF